jgi:hypothetical protein
LSTNIFCLSARNRKRKNCKRLGCVQPKSSSVWHTGLSGGASDSIRCARLDSCEKAALEKNRRCTAIIHRTVRWCTGLSGEPTVASATVGRAIRGRRVARANGQQGAPDCPVRQPARSCNSCLRHKLKEIGIGPSTVTVAEPHELFQLKCLSHASGAVTHLNRNNPSVPQI